ncbi:MAG: hypothetical protein JNK48_10935 [Bryobacterales bacterium]|nr:hypothetical protein [Bryobacterales bacterium]
MPRHTEWIQRIPNALAELNALPCPTIDRRTLQDLFHVSPRQAVRILSSLGCYTAGKSLLIERRDLIAKLESLTRCDAIRIELARQERVNEHLERHRRELQARRKKIPIHAGSLGSRMASLPPEVSLEPGHLSIRFAGAEDLLAKLYALAQAISCDYNAFEAAVD